MGRFHSITREELIFRVTHREDFLFFSILFIFFSIGEWSYNRGFTQDLFRWKLKRYCLCDRGCLCVWDGCVSVCVCGFNHVCTRSWYLKIQLKHVWLIWSVNSNLYYAFKTKIILILAATRAKQRRRFPLRWLHWLVAQALTAGGPDGSKIAWWALHLFSI